MAAFSALRLTLGRLPAPPGADHRRASVSELSAPSGAGFVLNLVGWIGGRSREAFGGGCGK